MSTVEKFSCDRCGAQAGIAGGFSDDPDEYDDQLIDQELFEEEWARRHEDCRPPAQRQIPLWSSMRHGSKVAPRRARNKVARKSRRINRSRR